MCSNMGVGYKFVPMDSELVGHYLYNWVFGLPLSTDVVKEFDLYGNEEPWQIWELFGGKENEDLYFFTPLKKRSKKSSRICRVVGSGAWQGEDSGKSILDEETGKEIGFKKRFRYENKDSEHNGGWIMHEYTLLGCEEYVLCRIRKNDKSSGGGRKRKSRKSQSQEHQEESKIFKRFRPQLEESESERAPMSVLLLPGTHHSDETGTSSSMDQEQEQELQCRDDLTLSLDELSAEVSEEQELLFDAEESALRDNLPLDDQFEFLCLLMDLKAASSSPIVCEHVSF